MTGFFGTVPNKLSGEWPGFAFIALASWHWRFGDGAGGVVKTVGGVEPVYPREDSGVPSGVMY
jgi:hypothetical protein